jgi:hypothetical protein
MMDRIVNEAALSPAGRSSGPIHVEWVRRFRPLDESTLIDTDFEFQADLLFRDQRHR